jgi:hypothetical protein
MFDLLLSKGADINQPGECGRTPLLVAVLAANREKAQWLIGEAASQGAKTDLVSRKEPGFTQVWLAKSQQVLA